MEPEAGGGRDNLWGMSGRNIAHIRTSWAECIHAARPSPFRDPSVRSLALVDKAELTAVPRKFECAMTTAVTLCHFAFLNYQSRSVAKSDWPWEPRTETPENRIWNIRS